MQAKKVMQTWRVAGGRNEYQALFLVKALGH